MSHATLRRLRPAHLLLVLAGLALPVLLTQEAPASALQDGLAPTAAQVKTARRVLKELEQQHYRQPAVDDVFSSGMLDRFVEFLDPSRAYFQAGDLQEFERYRTQLDDALRAGDVAPAFEIFSRYQARRKAELEWLFEALGRIPSMKFDTDESFVFDRRKAAWPSSDAEQRELWNKRFANEVLTLELTDKTPEEIQTTLRRRYENQRHRLGQTTGTDVFQVYMNAFTMGADPHTMYFAPHDAEEFDIQMSLSLEGIGALLTTEDEYVKVQRLVAGGPAEKAGELQPSDRIVGVAQDQGEMVDVIGWRLDEVVDLIRGAKGTVVRLELLPASSVEGGARRTISITRDEVKLEDQAATSRTIETERDGVTLRLGVIELPTFYMDFEAYRAGDRNFRSSTRDVENLVRELKDQGVDGIVVDLRNNGGGSLMEARDLSALFLGRRPIVQIRDRRGVETLVGHKPALYDGPLAVLVNRLSASASEIFAGAVQDYGRGLVIGDRTFGKGTVQNVGPLGDGQLKVTQAKFYRVAGGSTQVRGVEPDIWFPPDYDPERIGESAQDGALPWDSIDPVKGLERFGGVGFLDELRQRHEARSEGDPDFVRRTQLLAQLDQARHRTTISLNKEARLRERAEAEARSLEIENTWRVAKGLEPVASLEEAASHADPEADPDGEEAEATPIVREGAEILADWITLDRERTAGR